MVHLSLKHQEKLLQTPIMLTLDQCLGICRHYKSLKYHLETNKPKTVEYLQKRHKSKGHGHGQGSPSHHSTPKPGKGRGNPTPGRSECSNCGKIHQGNVCPARRSVCYGCNKRGHFKTMCQSSKRTPCTSNQSKVVQEVQAQEDQNTGNKIKNVDIVEMIRSMGLCECQAKNPQNANVQEMSIVHELIDTKPVFHTPVQAQIVMTVWEQNEDLVMESNFHLATPVEHCIFEMKQINMITVHDMELTSAHYSNVSINGQIVQVKQDTGAKVNMMSKCIFDRLSSSTNRNSVLLNKTKMVKISGYGENSIEYMGTCVFKVSHNNHHRDILFFITNVKDTKVILGAKNYQEFNLVKIVCDDKCPCKTTEIMSINQEFPVGLSVPDVKPRIILPPVDLNTKIDVVDPKAHIMNLFPDLFEDVSTMENVQVHLDVNPQIEPVVQAPRKIPHSMMEPLKAELDCMLKLGVI